MNGFKETISPLLVVKESDSPFVNSGIRRATLEEIIESFTKRIKELEESGVEFSTVVVDSYSNIQEQ